VYVLSLQQVIEDGELKLNEPMVDLNNKILEVRLYLEKIRDTSLSCYY